MVYCVLCLLCWCVLFFFFKQKTAYEMRISDWSSDVCSSDLRGLHRHVDAADDLRAGQRLLLAVLAAQVHQRRHFALGKDDFLATEFGEGDEIGRASCRERVCQYV